MSCLGIFDFRLTCCTSLFPLGVSPHGKYCFIAKWSGTMVGMDKEIINNNEIRDKYVNILQGYGFSIATAGMVANVVAYHPGNEREALESIGASPALVNASLEALGIETFD